MPRTADRPLPAGRLRIGEVLRFGAVTIVLGLVYLAVAVNWLTAALGGCHLVAVCRGLYAAKSRTPLNTAVGAVAGALPTLMGWAAVGGSLSFASGGGGLKAVTLFLIVFLWQFPAFHGHRLDLSPAIRRGRFADAHGGRSERPPGRHASRAAAAGPAAGQPVPVLQYAGLDLFRLRRRCWGCCIWRPRSAFCWRRDEASARRLLRSASCICRRCWLLLMLVPLV